MLSNTGLGVTTRLVGEGRALGDLTVSSTTDRHQSELTGRIGMDLERNFFVSIQGQAALRECRQLRPVRPDKVSILGGCLAVWIKRIPKPQFISIVQIAKRISVNFHNRRSNLAFL